MLQLNVALWILLRLALTVLYIQLNTLLFISLSLSTAPGVASVNSACRCVHLPNGGTLCDPVGCELVHVKHCPTMIQFSAYCTIGDTENVKEEKLDKGKSYSTYSSNCWSGSLYCDSVSKQSEVTSSGYKITRQAVLSFRYVFLTQSNEEKKISSFVYGSIPVLILPYKHSITRNKKHPPTHTYIFIT